MTRRRTVLALLPFRVKGALSLKVLRAMRARGMDVAVAYTATPGNLTLDPADDFQKARRLVDLSQTGSDGLGEAVEREIRDRNVGLVLQIGANALYRHLPYLKERRPRLRILDTLYNEVGHVVDHFLYERCFDGVIVESQYMRRYVERCSSRARPNVLVVESGIDLGEFSPAAAEPRAASRLVVGYVGRMSPEKNPLGFVELCERLHASTPSLSFRMIGDGPLAEDVRRRIAASGARHAFEYQGYQPDLVAAMRRLDVIVVPSKLDGRPVVIMEANACGVPVIGAPIGGIPELIEEGRNGYLLDPAERERIADLLARWSGDRSALAELKRSARATAERRFDERLMLDRYEAVFREHLGAA